MVVKQEVEVVEEEVVEKKVVEDKVLVKEMEEHEIVVTSIAYVCICIA